MLVGHPVGHSALGRGVKETMTCEPSPSINHAVWLSRSTRTASIAEARPEAPAPRTGAYSPAAISTHRSVEQPVSQDPRRTTNANEIVLILISYSPAALCIPTTTLLEGIWIGPRSSTDEAISPSVLATWEILGEMKAMVYVPASQKS
jgi:hypothetical protein